MAVLGACSLSVLDGLSDGHQDAGDDGSSSNVVEMRGADASMETTFSDVSLPDATGNAIDASAPPKEAASSDVADATTDVPVDSGSCIGGCPGNGYCYTTECAYPSCKDRLMANPGSPSRVYWIDTDGKAGADPPFKAYCEMVGDGGGWTLVMKMDGALPTFRHNEPLWTNDTAYQVDNPDFDRTEAKLIAFSKMPFSKIRVGIVDTIARWLVFDLGTTPSMYALMSGAYRSTSVGRDQWKSLVSSPSLQLNCNREGINVQEGAAYVRIGIVSNNDPDCNTCDSWIGLGGHAAGDTYSCGNVAYNSSDNGDRNNYFFGYVMVR